VSEAEPVLVTGAGGFIGRALVAHFAQTGRPLRALVRSHDGAPAPRPPACAGGDLATADDVHLSALVAGTSAVVHLAGRAHVQDETAGDPDRKSVG
jgi:UDP-glucose 4-epimerase